LTRERGADWPVPDGLVRFDALLADSVADALDNALAEAIRSLDKTECVHTDGRFDALAQVQPATADQVRWYHQEQLYSTLG
jgi:hypothetical protein